MLSVASPPPNWKTGGVPSAAAFIVEAAAEVSSVRGAKPSPEKMSYFVNNMRADPGIAGYAAFWLFGTWDAFGRSTGREIGAQVWTRSFGRDSSNQKPVKGATC